MEGEAVLAPISAGDRDLGTTVPFPAGPLLCQTPESES